MKVYPFITIIFLCLIFVLVIFRILEVYDILTKLKKEGTFHDTFNRAYRQAYSQTTFPEYTHQYFQRRSSRPSRSKREKVLRKELKDYGIYTKQGLEKSGFLRIIPTEEEIFRNVRKLFLWVRRKAGKYILIV